MNRITAPSIKTIQQVDLPRLDVLHLDNGVPVYCINAGNQDVVKVELMYRAGKWYEEKNLVSDLANRMLREGTRQRSAREIAESFDFYGANINYGAAFETGGAVLYSLTRQIDHLLPLLQEIMTEPAFPENELQTITANRKQRLSVELKKNDYVANREFVKALYGPIHPYGRVTEPSDLEAVNTADLKCFFEEYYTPAHLTIIVAGKFGDQLINGLNKCFGQAVPGKRIAEKTYKTEGSADLIHDTRKPESVQTAIVLGNISINKSHPDFLKLTVLNTVLGGFFGSRLMSNIREEKGYTYGIYSSLVSYPHGGFIEIATEVGKEFRDATLEEIKKEIETLRSGLITQEELDVVKNYMSGKVLRSIDGPMKYSDTVRGLVNYGQTPDYVHQLLRTIRQVTPEELLELANKYFDFQKMHQVTVG